MGSRCINVCIVFMRSEMYLSSQYFRYRNANWRNLQLAAASTTQLYKSGLDMKKRSFERGFNSGRQALAKEIYGLCRYSGTKIDVGTLLSRCSPLSTDMHAISPRRQRNPSIQAAEMTSSSAAVVILPM